MSYSLWPYRLQHLRLLCPSQSPGICSNSCPLSQWCYLTISFSVIPCSFCLQSFPASGFFPSEKALHIRWSKYWSFSFNISPSNVYSGLISFRIDGLISLLSKDSQESSPSPQFKSISSLAPSFLYGLTLTSIHDYWKNLAWTIWTFVRKMMPLLFNMLRRFVTAFPPRSKCLLTSWLQSLSIVILEPKKIKSVTASTFSLSICNEVMELEAMIFVF